MADPALKVDVQKLPNQASGTSGESVTICLAWHCPDGIQFLSYLQKLSATERLLPSVPPIFESTGPIKSLAVEKPLSVDNLLPVQPH